MKSWWHPCHLIIIKNITIHQGDTWIKVQQYFSDIESQIQKHYIYTAWKESHVWQPRANRFCYIALLNSDLNITCQQSKWSIWGNSNFRRTLFNTASIKHFFFKLFKKTLGLVHVNYRLPGWQVVKLTFFAVCYVWATANKEENKTCWILLILDILQIQNDERYIHSSSLGTA